MHPRLEPTHQRRLLPQRIRLLLIPLPALLAKLQIKVPENSRQNQAHFVVRQVLADAVPRTIREWLQHVSFIIVEWRRRIVHFFREPTLGNESVWFVEVKRRGVG